MSTITWRGDAPAVKQVDTNVIGGTWATNDWLRATCNGKSVTFTCGATQTVAAMVAGFVAAWNASTTYEHAEITAADANPNITLTCDTAGMPFTVTWTKSSASGTISASTTTANSGPASLATLANYSGGALPVNGDTLVFENSGQSCLWELDALDDLTTLTIIRKHSYTGLIGLPREHVSGATRYTEYRPRAFKAGMVVLDVGEGEGSGSGRSIFDANGSNPAITVAATGQSIERGVPALLIINTGATTTLDVTKGSVGIAFFAGETASLNTLDISYQTSQAGDVTLVCGSGVTIAGTIHQTGGKLTVESNVTALIQDAGEATFNGTATLNMADINGTVYDNSSGLWQDIEIKAKGKYDHRRSMVAKTINGHIWIDDGGEFHDPYEVVTVPDGFACNPEKVVLDTGERILTPSGT